MLSLVLVAQFAPPGVRSSDIRGTAIKCDATALTRKVGYGGSETDCTFARQGDKTVLTRLSANSTEWQRLALPQLACARLGGLSSSKLICALVLGVLAAERCELQRDRVCVQRADAKRPAAGAAVS